MADTETGISSTIDSKNLTYGLQRMRLERDAQEVAQASRGEALKILQSREGTFPPVEDQNWRLQLAGVSAYVEKAAGLPRPFATETGEILSDHAEKPHAKLAATLHKLIDRGPDALSPLDVRRLTSPDAELPSEVRNAVAQVIENTAELKKALDNKNAGRAASAA